MPERTRRLPVVARSSALFLAAVVAAACGGPTATPSPSGPVASSSPTPTAQPTTGDIEHATGPTDVVLRIEQGGGLVPIEFFVTQAPAFTLFGNGVVVFQRAATTFPEPDANGVLKPVPWRTASLDESQVQDLLAFALGPGGLGTARTSYRADGVADAPDTIFTIRAGGVDKTVVVNALSEATQTGADGVARAAFAVLAKRLLDFDQGGTIGSDAYRPDRYRGVLTERNGGQAGGALDWPWPTLKPSDFKAGPSDGSGGPTLPHRTMSADEVAALKLADIEGGVQGLTIKGPDGKTYGFILRPLLADEQE